MNFSEKMTELEKILKKLESENIPLEESLSDFEHGVKLIKECRTFLEDAKQKVTILTDSGEQQRKKA